MFKSKAVSSLIAGLALTLGAAGAQAVPLTMISQSTDVSNSGANPCIIAANNCPGNPINFTNFAGGNFNGSSPIYTYTPGTMSGLNFGASVFNIAVDSGAARAGTDTLASFSLDVDNDGAGAGGFVTLYTFTGTAGNIGNPINNGNGFADYLLQSFDLAAQGVTAGAFLRFNATITNETGGPESFYVVPGRPGQVPLPGSLALLALGALGIAKFGRRAK